MDKELANKLVDDVMNEFAQYGVFEWINSDMRKLDTYVASATNMYGFIKRAIAEGL